MRYIPALFILSVVALVLSIPTHPNFAMVGQLHRIDGGYGSATPVKFSVDGFLVLTCEHVVSGLEADDPFTLTLNGVEYTDGMVVWSDVAADTALVRFVSTDRPALAVLTTMDPRPYSRGYAAGFPLGVDELVVGDVLFQISPSIISHLTGPGGSGGPVFDEFGRVCGIVSMIRTPQVSPYGRAYLGWITTISLLDSVIEELR